MPPWSQCHLDKALPWLCSFRQRYGNPYLCLLFVFWVDICLFLSMIKRQIAICLKKRYTFVEVKLHGTESLLPTWAWLCEGLSVRVWQAKDFSVSASQHRVEKCHFAGNIGIYGSLLCNSSGKHVLYFFDVLKSMQKIFGI